MYSMFDFKTGFDFRLFGIQELATYKIEAMNILPAISLFIGYFRSGKVVCIVATGIIVLIYCIAFIAET